MVCMQTMQAWSNGHALFNCMTNMQTADHHPFSQLSCPQGLKTCISHYHPDKKSDSDDRTYVLHEEIIKYLNQKYSMFK